MQNIVTSVKSVPDYSMVLWLNLCMNYLVLVSTLFLETVPMNQSCAMVKGLGLTAACLMQNNHDPCSLPTYDHPIITLDQCFQLLVSTSSISYSLDYVMILHAWLITVAITTYNHVYTLSLLHSLWEIILLVDGALWSWVGGRFCQLH